MGIGYGLYVGCIGGGYSICAVCGVGVRWLWGKGWV